MPRASMTVRTLAQSAGVDLIEKLLALPYCEQATWFFPLAPQPLWMKTSCYNHTIALEEKEQDTFTEFWFGDSIKHHFEDIA